MHTPTITIDYRQIKCIMEHFVSRNLQEPLVALHVGITACMMYVFIAMISLRIGVIQIHGSN